MGEVSSIDADFISAKTIDDYTIELLLSKPLDFNSFNVGLLNNPNQAFEVHIDNINNILINGIQYDPNFPRVIQLQLNSAIQGWSSTTGSATKIDVSYSGNQIDALDGTPLAMFSYKPVSNILSCTYNCIPGKIEAENYFFESGISVEGCSDVDGGYNIGYLNTGDYVDYYINAKYSGSFQVSYRNASDGHNGSLEMQLIDSLGNATTLNTANFTSTGGWQNWQTTNTSDVFWLNKGIHHIRVLITLQEYNLNWFQFDITASNKEFNKNSVISISPNPVLDYLKIKVSNDEIIKGIYIYDLYGKLILNSQKQNLNLDSLSKGLYIIKVFTNKNQEEFKIFKT